MTEGKAPAFNELLVGLFRATTLLARQTAEAHGLSLHQTIALDVVRRQLPQPMAELAKELELTMGGVSKLVDRLVALGLVARRPHPTDRRALRLVLTPEGEALSEAVRADWERLMGAWIAGVAPEHRIEPALAALMAAAPPLPG